jgi:fumarate reductase flavoprotein subunit
LKISTGLIQETLRHEQAKIDGLLSGSGTEDAAALMTQMQEVMTEKVGIFRGGPRLEQAVVELEQLLLRSRNIGLRYKARGANPELVTAYRVQKMLKLALCVACGAYARTESRGAHFREDFPRRDDAQWLGGLCWRRPIPCRRSATTTELENGCLPAAVTGEDIEHQIPRGLAREAQSSQRCDRVRHRDDDAHERLLPERFRGRNERSRADKG